MSLKLEDINKVALMAKPMPEKEQQITVAVKQPAQPLSFLGTTFEDTAKALQSVFGTFPIQLNRFEHEQVLAGMAAAAGQGGTPYKQLLDKLKTYENIEVRLT